MPSASIAHSRAVDGRFACQTHGMAVASRASRQARQHGAVPLWRIRNASEFLAGYLLLTTALPAVQASSPQRAHARLSPTPPCLQPGALLPAASASQAGARAPDAPLLSRALPAVSNGVIATCVAQPRHCAAALAAGGVMLGTSALVAATWPAARPAPAPSPAGNLQRQDQLVAAVERVRLPGDGGPADALLEIARACGGDRRCRADRINTLLETLPPATLAQLQAMVDRTAQAPSGKAPARWPPGADAFPLAGKVALEALADALAMLYTPEAAAFQDDVETIVTRTSGDTAAGASQGVVWVEANRSRQRAIAALLQRDAGTVERLPYVAHGLEGLGLGDVSDAFNLRARLHAASDGSPARHLLLVAHGDMIGLSRGSQGAYDNASGVATLLHVARQLAAAAPLSDTQVDLLVTSHEELGLLGARAYVAQCLEQGDCPTWVINVDMVGRGGHSYVLSGSDALAASPYLGRAPMFLRGFPPGAEERRATLLFEQQFAANGFTRAVAGHPHLLTSDNVAFQNASIPCVGVAQMSAVDAEAWVLLDAARQEWLACDAQVDWSRRQAHQDGELQLTASEVAEQELRYQAADQAWERLQALRAEHSLAPQVLIHGSKDRLHRVSAPMGVAFAEALVDVVRRWSQESPANTPASA